MNKLLNIFHSIKKNTNWQAYEESEASVEKEKHRSLSRKFSDLRIHTF